MVQMVRPGVPLAFGIQPAGRRPRNSTALNASIKAQDRANDLIAATSGEQDAASRRLHAAALRRNRQSNSTTLAGSSLSVLTASTWAKAKPRAVMYANASEKVHVPS